MREKIDGLPQGYDLQVIERNLMNFVKASSSLSPVVRQSDIGQSQAHRRTTVPHQAVWPEQTPRIDDWFPETELGVAEVVVRICQLDIWR